MTTLQLWIVADDGLARAGLASLLTGWDGIAVAAQMASPSVLPAAARTADSVVVLWDLGWDPSPNLELPDTPAGQLAGLLEVQVPVLVLLPDEGHVREIWQAGVRGLLLRTASAAELVAALWAVSQGLAVLDPALATALVAHTLFSHETSAEALTPREHQVLELLAQGLTNRAIARRLEISEHTAKFHVNAILGKLGAQSRTDAVVRATRLGLIAL